MIEVVEPEAMKARMRILAFAYACDPEHGSEPGTGWIWSRMLAHLGETWVVTRANNRASIERALLTVPERERLHFVYVDLPHWARSWKRGQRGVRLYYLLWQLAALRRARRLAKSVSLDLVWHVTFGNVWLGSLAPLVGKPFVYGPVGGGTGMPWRLLRGAGLHVTFSELSRGGARLVGRYLNPASRLACRRATVILVQNLETRQWLPKHLQSKAILFQHVVIDDLAKPPPRRSRDRRVALFAGRLVYWKGAEFALRAIALAPGWKLVIHGRGPEEAKLRRLAEALGIEDRVTFAGTVDRYTLLERMRTEFDVFLFPSLHDDAPWAVAEAVSAGLPVICVDRGGPPLLAGPAAITVACSDRETMVRDLAIALRTARFPQPAEIAKRAQELTLEHKIKRLREVVLPQLNLRGAEYGKAALTSGTDDGQAPSVRSS